MLLYFCNNSSKAVSKSYQAMYIALEPSVKWSYIGSVILSITCCCLYYFSLYIFYKRTLIFNSIDISIYLVYFFYKYFNFIFNLFFFFLSLSFLFFPFFNFYLFPFSFSWFLPYFFWALGIIYR